MLAMSCFFGTTKPRPRAKPLSLYLASYHVLLLGLVVATNAIHHMKRAPLQYVSQRDETRPLVVSNQCKEIIYPGIATQAGTPPKISGFQLTAGQTVNLTVSADWQGRVWGRTNCSFNSAGTGPGNSGGYSIYGRACGTGDCGGTVNCPGTVGVESQPHPNLPKSAEQSPGGHPCDAGRVHACVCQWPDLL